MNYRSTATCACIGENLAVTLPLVLGIIRMPLLDRAEVELHLGGSTSWDQRRAFEWGLIGHIAWREGDGATANYCASRLRELHAR